MLQEEFVQTGGWLFRWRSYVPLVFAAALFASLSGFSYPLGSHFLDQAWDLVCFGVSLCGFAVRIVTVGFVPRDTSGRNTRGQVALAVNTTGMYSILRHPLYFGNFWMWMGVALFPRVWWMPPLTALAFIVFYERIMFAEERFLSEKFAPDYSIWAEKTPVFWPVFRNWSKPALPFSWRAVLRRENSTFLGITVAFNVLEVTGTRIVEGEWEADWLWLSMLVFALLLYAVPKALKKLKWLNEPGR